MAVRAIACEAVAVRDIGVLLGTEKTGWIVWPTISVYRCSILRYKKIFVLRKKYDVWHCLHQDSKFLPLNSHSKLILTVHDLNFLSEHHLNDEKICARLGRLQRKIDRADIIVTISHYTKKVLEENLNVKNKRVEVIYNGCSMSEQSEPEMPSFAPAGDFLFSIGSIASRKNLHVLLPLMQKLPGISLVMAGSYAAEGDYYRALQQQIRDLNLADRVMMPGAISEAEKVWLYQRCCGLVFPSLLEGFGLPIVEAMYFGQPVFLSTSTSLPEVGGDAAYYWENFDADSMAQVVRQGLTCHNAARVALCKNRRQNFLGRTPRRNICNFIEIYDECHRGIRTNRVIGCAIFFGARFAFAVTDSRVHPPGWDELKKWHPRLKLF